jgi:hypothetical protein
LKATDWDGQIDIDLEYVTEQTELESCEIVMRNGRDGLFGLAAQAADRLFRALTISGMTVNHRNHRHESG